MESGFELSLNETIVTEMEDGDGDTKENELNTGVRTEFTHSFPESIQHSSHYAVFAFLHIRTPESTNRQSL